MSTYKLLRCSDSAITVSMQLPGINDIAAGVFFLARCESGDSTARAWETYLRRPLFPTHFERTPESATYTFLLPQGDDAGYAWLRTRDAGSEIDLLGPFGNGFTIDSAKPNLLLAADYVRAPLLSPLVDAALDRGGRVTLLVRTQETEIESANDWLACLPFAVEARAETPAHFSDTLAYFLPWADQLCVAFAPIEYAALARIVRSNRMRPLPRFSQALVITDLPCGIGACLACVVPLARGGHTRACKHGPVFDLLELA